MSVIVNAGAPQQAARRDAGNSLGGCIVGLGLILFGTWFAATKTVEFAAGFLHNPETGQAAEMRMLQERMNCEPGEVLEIRPLGDAGAKAVRCVAGDNMPPVRSQAEGDLRG